MKSQRYRFKLIAFLLAGLLALAGAYGVRTIPLTGSGDSLRDAILRLTGQTQAISQTDEITSPGVSGEPSVTLNAEGQATGEPLETISDSAATPVPSDSVSPSLLNSLGQILFPQATDSPIPTPSETPTDAGLNGLGQVLFPQSSENPATSASPESTVTNASGQILFPQVSEITAPVLSPDAAATVTPQPPLSEALSNYFGSASPEPTQLP